MRIAFPSLCAAALALALSQPDLLGAQRTTPEESAALAVAESALAAVSRSDFVGFTDFMLDSAVTFSAGIRDGQHVVQFRTRAQQRAVPAGHYTERGFWPRALVSGPVAMVWMPYDFYRDGKWSHCGVDVFTLVRTEDRWRIATLVWSVDQPPSCARHPDGPPPDASAN